jgi:hypothetical protein
MYKKFYDNTLELFGFDREKAQRELKSQKGSIFIIGKLFDGMKQDLRSFLIQQVGDQNSAKLTEMFTKADWYEKAQIGLVNQVAEVTEQINGINLDYKTPATRKSCRYGFNCRRKGCPFQHPNGKLKDEKEKPYDRPVPDDLKEKAKRFQEIQDDFVVACV